MKEKTLLILPNNATSTLSNLIPYFVEFEIVKTISCNLYMSYDVSYILNDIEAIIIDNENYITDSAVNDIALYFINKNKRVYLYKELSCYNYNIQDFLHYLYPNSSSICKNNIHNSISLPVIYISGMATVNEIITSHLLLNKFFCENNMCPLNISNFPLSQNIGFLSLDHLFFDDQLDLNNICHNLTDHLNTYLENKDIIIISNVNDCINITSFSFDLNDIIKNIIPYDYVLYFISLSHYSPLDVERIIEKIQVKTGCSTVDLSLSHYFYDFLNKNIDHPYLHATDNEYNNILDDLNSNLSVIYDALSYDHITEYIRKISCE